MEVIAHGKASPAPLPPPWLSGAHPGRLVRQAPPATQADPAEGQRSIPQLVQQGHLDRGPAAGPADPGALVPGVRGQGLADPATVVDHGPPFRGDWDLFTSPANLQSLCKYHHDQKTAREQAERQHK